jgi:hypothetical protein
MTTGAEFFPCIVIVACSVFLSAIIAMGFNNGAWKSEAVKHQAAEYVLNPSTGEVTWKWKQ